VLEFAPDGSGRRVYASGIRNAVGIAGAPALGRAVGRRSTSATSWATTWSPTTSRTSTRGAFYGWPWYYIGGNQDPRHAASAPS
jgi:glucose/arabinose dehydrogenase